MAGQGLTWKPFTPSTMPPIDNQKRFLVLHGLHKADRILCVGVHCQYGSSAPYIRIVSGNKGWWIPTEEQLKDAAWAAVDIDDRTIMEIRRCKKRLPGIRTGR